MEAPPARGRGPCCAADTADRTEDNTVMNIEARGSIAQLGTADINGDGPAPEVGGHRQTLVELQRVSFAYRPDEPILRDFNLTVHRREFLVLLGPSGCGKTTTMDLIAGFLFPTGGHVLFGGKPLRAVNTGVGYMTQGDTLLPWKTVATNVGLPLSMRKVPRQEIAERVDSFLRMLDLQNSAHKYPSELSGGMKRRALLARSLIYEPEMLLMDEPFAALDAQLRERMQQELLNTVERLNQSVLFITHDLVEAVLLGDRIVVMGREGRGALLELASPFGHSRNLEQIRTSVEFFQLETKLREALRHA